MSQGNGGEHKVKGTLTFNDDESYEAYRRGDANFKNGLRNRAKGTMYRQPDFEEEDEAEYEVVEYKPKRYEDFSPLGQLVIDVAGIIVTSATDYLTDLAITSFDNWLENKRRNKQKNVKKNMQTLDRKALTKAEKILQERKPSAKMSVDLADKPKVTEDFDRAYEQCKENMSSKEAQKELIDIFFLNVIREKKIRRLRNAKIISEDGTREIDGEEILERLCSPEVVKLINGILIEKPSFIEEWQSIALSDILGRELIVDERYIPIGEDNLKTAINK